MQHLKDVIINSSTLCCLDYESSLEVILAIDTSVIVVRYILSQLGEGGRRYPNRFSSLSLTEVESCYSQAKLKLYGLFRTLRAVHIFIFGLTNFTVEMDAKWVKGMINNLDLQPNMTINRWIAGILLFSFRLVHVPTTHHTGADRLSCHPSSDEDLLEEDNFEDWLDNAYSFFFHILNNCLVPFGTFAHFSRSHLYICPSSTHSVYINATSATVDTIANDPAIPCTPKALAKDAWVDLIHWFLDMQICLPDLSNADYKSFINAATCFFLVNNTLYHQEPHG